MTLQADPILVAAEAAYAVERTVARASGRLDGLPWPELADEERLRWRVFASNALSNGEKTGEVGQLATDVVLAVAKFLGLNMPHAAGSIEPIAEAVSRRTGVSVQSMLDPGRNKQVAFARNLAMLLAREAGFSYQTIGTFFGNRDHTTVMANVRKLAENLAANRLTTREMAHYAAGRAAIGAT